MDALRKEKARIRAAAQYAANPDLVKARAAAYSRSPAGRSKAAARRRVNVEAKKEYDKSYRQRPDVRLRKTWEAARRRAAERGIPFSLDFESVVWPETCPALGVPIDYSLKPTRRTVPCSPSLDRLRPDLGYTNSNVRVISLRANLIKSNATAAEVEAVAKWMRKEGL